MPELITLPFNPSPRLHDYTGLWFIRAQEGSAWVQIAKGMDWAQHAAAFVGSRDPRDQTAYGARLAYILHDNAVAEVQLSGTLMKHESSMEESTSTVFARRALRQAAADERVIAIVLRIDSPGGTVSGTDDLGADVAAINATKPVIAYAEDLMASAAYWIGCQSRAIYANSKTALIGSIGTFMGLYDYSEAAKQDGIEALVFATGELKGTGFPGTKVTEKQRAYLQNLVDENQVLFNEAISKGRGISAEDVERLATGEVWKAGEAQRLGLIDGIDNFDAVLAYAAGLAKTTNTPQKGSDTMGANAKEIKEACIGADAEFIMSQLEAEASIEQAKTAYIGTLAAKVENRDGQLAELKTAHSTAVEGLKAEHAEAVLALDAKIEELETKIENIKLGATDEEAASGADAEGANTHQRIKNNAMSSGQAQLAASIKLPKKN